MKKYFLLFVLTFLPYFVAVAQTIGDYKSNIASGNWSVAGNWLRWNGTSWVTATTAPNTSSGTITIQSGHFITQNTASLNVDQLVIDGTLATTAVTIIAQGTGIDLQINSGGILTIGNTLTINGEMSNYGSVTDNATLTIATAGSLTNNSNGTITVSSTKTLNNNGRIINSGTITNSSGTINMNSASTYQHNFPNSSIAQGTIPTSTWNSSSTCEVIACGNTNVPNGLNQNFGNFIWNYSTQLGPMNLGGKPSTVLGDFEIRNTNSQNLTFITDAVASLNVSDTFKLNCNTTFTLLSGTASSVVSLSTKVFYQTNGVFDMTSSSGGASNSYVYVQSYFSHLGGIFTKTGASSSSSVIINGSTGSYIESIGFNIVSPAINFSISCTGASGVCNILSSKNFILNSNTNFSITDNTAVTNDFVVTGTYTANASTWNFSTGVTLVNGRFKNQNTGAGTSTAAALQFASGSVFEQNADGGTVPMATWDVNSTVEITGILAATVLNGGGQNFGKILWNSPSQTSSLVFGSIGFGTQSDYTISSTGSGFAMFPDVDFTIGGNLTIQNSAQLQYTAGVGLTGTGTRSVTVNGNVLISNSALFSIGNPATSSAGNAYREKFCYLYVKQNFTHSSSVPMVTSITKNWTGNGGDRYFLIVSFTGGTTQYVTANPQSQNLYTYSGDGVFNGGSDDELRTNNFFHIYIDNNSSVVALSDLKYSRLYITTGSLDLSTGSSYNLYQYQTLSNTGAVSNGVTSNSGILIMGFGVLYDANGTGTFVLNGSAEIRTKHTQGISTAASTGCIQNTGTRTISSVGTKFVYNGNSSQVTGDAIPSSISGAGAFLEIDNSTSLSSGGVSMSKAVTITQGTLKLTNGKFITTSTLLLSLGSTAAVSPVGGSAASFVDGPIRKTGYTSGVEFVFPIGDTAKWARISLLPTSTSSTASFTAEYFKKSYTSLTPVDATTLDHVSAKEYWNLTRTVVGTNGKVKLYWEDATWSGIPSPSSSDLRVAHYYNPGAGTKWYSEGTSPIVSVSGSTGSIQSDIDVTTFSPFTFGAPNGINPLPIELLNFFGEPVASGNLLKWSTATELNNDYFVLERSKNGIDFSPIASIDGAGNSLSTNQYEYTDRNLEEKLNYYRLKQVDYNGEYTYSAIISIYQSSSESYVDVYPNPSYSGIINISSSDDILAISIYNSLGDIVRKINTQATSNFIKDINLAAGVYILKAETSSNTFLSSKIIIEK